ncbi:acyl carrier protein [Ruminiclostridium herbifermentans]|uniref:Acyl carrier protein n=1 Tax=Ruminiclostridium herbifermentans TaxID=2488810 RepID=A0A7H1VMT2_9FIRM|nr:acyl carrier protein [Ruminiclostridium herbifermentans]QNU66694.1 acyl carrier protein [Ruminiclostridium herbifermentans]
MDISKDKIVEIFSKTVGADISEFADLKVTDDLRDWGLDSLKSIDVIVAIEEEYDIAIEDYDLLLDNFNTVEKMIKLIEKYVQ